MAMSKSTVDPRGRALSCVVVLLQLSCVTGVPTLVDLSSRWMDPTLPASVEASLGAEQRDLPTINNFWGAAGIAPQGVRPVDMFGVNSLEFPPFVGCGSDGATSPQGCGSLFIDSVQVIATGTRWAAYEASRRSSPQNVSNIVVESATRMPFESNGVFWMLNFSNSGDTDVTIRVDFKLSATVGEFATVGTWVYDVPNDYDAFNYSTFEDVNHQKGTTASSISKFVKNKHEHGDDERLRVDERPACARYVFVGDVQPDSVRANFTPSPPMPPHCSIAGLWIQEQSGDTFGPIVESADGATFSWTGNPKYKQDGWNTFNGTINSNAIVLKYYRTYPGIPNPGVVSEHGNFVDDCDHIVMSDSKWHRKGANPAPPRSSPIPNATFTAMKVPAGQKVSVRVALGLGRTCNSVTNEQERFATNATAFDSAWDASHMLWEKRWADAFLPNNGYWSGSLPTIDLSTSSNNDDDNSSNDNNNNNNNNNNKSNTTNNNNNNNNNNTTTTTTNNNINSKYNNAFSFNETFEQDSNMSANVERVYYMSALTVISNMRTNLPLVFDRVWPNGNGNVGAPTMGIGGSRSWWWDEALTSMMLALLEPQGRAPTFQAWLAHDDHPGTTFGHGVGNGYSLDCLPLGSSSCGFPPSQRNTSDDNVKKLKNTGPQYGFYCYNPWAFYMAMSNHLRINNDTKFLTSQAAKSSMNVEAALEGIATNYKEYLIPGTNLVDYGPSMDGFSPTYKHVMPGCSQGNNIWMLRDFAAFRESQGRSDEANLLRKSAAALANDTLTKMYESREGHGWFNVVSPGQTSDTLLVNEMRHVVDFFSVTFGLCGLTKDKCDFTETQRTELGNWFRKESVTKTWIRATSPYCNCSTVHEIPKNSTKDSKRAFVSANSEEYPAYPTCSAGRPDHGSNGAYPSWPAFALEALCYIDGNCSSAFNLMSTYSDNTYEGPFGQAHEVPQLEKSPYTPFNNVSAFKPTAGVTRYIAIEGGSFFDAIVRGFFGYHPQLQWANDTSSVQASLDATLNNPNVPKGFVGSLKNLRTPHGLATITSSAAGLAITLQRSDESN